MIALGIPNGMEWLIILVVILLLFGHRLPGMARSLGSGITEFKRGLKDGANKNDDGSTANRSGTDGNRPPTNGGGNPPTV